MKNLLLFIVFVPLLFSCKKENYLSVDRGTLLEMKEVKTLSSSKCIELVDSVDISAFANYDVELLEVVYATEYQGNVIETSGILMVPKNAGAFKLVTYCHGTVVPIGMFGQDGGTPSLFSGQSKKYIEIRNVGLTWASAGYTVFMPDYVGYGRTKKTEHPYIYYPELVKSVEDGVVAVKTYLQGLDANFSSNIVFAGYSQGAGAALFAHRKWEEETGFNDFDVLASINLSGPYNFKRFIQSVFEKKDNKEKNIPIYSWAMYSMNRFSELKRPNDYIFSYPVYDQGSAFLPPSTLPSKVFNNFFMQQIVNGNDIEMNALIKRNSIMGEWVPNGKVILFHGGDDTFVPYFNSEDCYANLQQLGADVDLFTYEGKGHRNVLPLFVVDAKTQLDLLAW